MEEIIIPIATEAAEYYGGLPSAQEVAFLEYQHELWKEDPKAWSPFISLEQLQNRPNLEIEWYAPNFIPVGGKVLLSAEPKCGKALCNGTPVLTPTGYVPIESLKVGDFVMGRNGEPTRVTGVFPQGVRQLYSIRFSCGSESICDGDHLWTLQSNNHNQTRTLTTLQWKEIGFRATHPWHLPRISPVEFPEQQYPINPYLLGVLLGDGGLSQSSVHFTTSDMELLHSVKSLIKPFDCTLTKVSKYDYILSHRKGCINPLTKELRHLGLMGHRSETKFIPKDYLFGSVSQRLSLLQGLLDTDGTVGKKYGRIVFSSSSRQLIEDVRNLVLSLGGFAKINSKKTNRLPHWNLSINFSRDIQPFRLSRKRVRLEKRVGKQRVRRIISIEPLCIAPATCIKVAACDELFLIHDYIPTHNTILLFHILNAVVNGRSFLGEKCTPAKVMYFTEQTEHEFKRQVREVPGLLGNPNFYVLLAEEVPANLRSWRLLLQFAEEKMKVIGAHIIVFDTFIGMARLPADGENDSATIQNCIDEANFLFKNRYLSIVFVHHARKSFEDSKGPRAVTMQSIRGSSAFVGGVGHVICMTAPDYTNTIRQCNFFGRYLHGTEMKLILIDGQYRQAGFKRG